MAGRSLHRSQDMGRLQTLGPWQTRMELLEDRTAEGAGGLFSGVDTSLAAMPWRDAPNIDGPASRRRFAARADSARRALGTGAYRRVITLLDRGKRDLLPQSEDTRAQLLFATAEQSDQRRHTERALGIAAGLMADALAGDDRMIPGQSDSVGVTIWNAGQDSMTVAGGVVPSAEWHVESDSGIQATLAPGEVRQSVLRLMPDTAAPLTEPYFMRKPRQGDLYDWSGAPAQYLGDPFEAAAPVARFGRLGPGGETSREVSRRFNDQAMGEVRQPVTVVPRLDVKLDPATYVWSLVAPGSRRFTVTLTHRARDTTSGTVYLLVPDGWPAVRPQRFRLMGEDEHETYTFDVRPPRGSGRGSATIRAVARDSSGREYGAGVVTVSYPHIRPRSYVVPARAQIHLAPVALPKLARIGYVRGASDLVPEALELAGLPVTVLGAHALEREDLSRFPAIVIGPRAYETDSALVDNNARMLAYVRGGGTLIVQYQQHNFFESNFAALPMEVGGPGYRLVADSGAADSAGTAVGTNGGPHFVTDTTVRPISHDRVVDEAAPIALLAPDHPVLHRPNRISSADWDGWIQERGLYFPRSWDEGYQPILETHDEGGAGAGRRTPGGDGWEGNVRLHRPQLLPAAAGGRAGGAPVVRESSRAWRPARSLMGSRSLAG